MKNLMEQLEQKLGTKHILVDDWNRLGWEFSTIPQTSLRVCTLVNYTECKAEGGSVTFTIDQENGYGDWRLRVLSAEGSGPHGISWWDEVILSYSDEPVKIDEAGVDQLGDALIHNCSEEGNSYYWRPWRDENPHRTLLFEDRAFGETDDRLVEVPHTSWSEEDWNEATSR
jgi:hypothetical protein